MHGRFEMGSGFVVPVVFMVVAVGCAGPTGPTGADGADGADGAAGENWNDEIGEVLHGDYTIQNNWDIAAIDGVTEITGDLYIEGSTLRTLEGLESLTTVGGDLEVYQCQELNSLVGLDNLTTVGEYFSIQFNYPLVSLDGLQNLTDVYRLDVYENVGITSISEMESLATVEDQVYVRYNDSLCQSEVDEWEASLDDSITVTSSNNDDGC